MEPKRELATKNSLKPVAGFSNLDAQDAWLMTLITQADMLKPGSPVMDESGLDLLLTLYTEALEQVGKAEFQAAFLEVMRCNPFRPDISEIRKAAGINRGIPDPLRDQAMKELRKLIAIMRVHWSQQSQKLVTVWGKDEQGNRTEEKAAPPALSEKSEAALRELGMGSRESGLLLIAGHPALSKDVDERYRVRNANEVERKWCEVWR